MSASASTAVSGEVVVTAEEAAAAALKKRYEGLVTVRNKAVKGKGAWYWAHLQPLLVHSSDTGLPKAVKLKCCLCDTVFSASNPSRTASEHLKRGTCPNFASPPQPTPVAVGEAVTHECNHRKRSSSSSSTGGGTPGVGGGGPSPSPTTNSGVARTSMTTAYDAPPVSVLRPNSLSNELGLIGSGALVVHQPEFQHLTSTTTTPTVAVGRVGSSEDVKMFEDSIKRLKSPKPLVGPTLSKSQIECGLHYLSDWMYESCGSISFSSLEHPKFKAFLQQMGMVEVSKREFLGPRLDSRFEEVRSESNARIRESMFFQIGSHGWKSRTGGFEENLVSVTANLPNGTSVYRRAVFNSGKASGKLAEEVLWGAISEICGNSVHRCVGIVADRFKNSVLKSLEGRYQWMINLSCQCQAFDSLIQDFYKELPLFKNVVGSCRKLANFVNNGTLRNCFFKYQLRMFRNVLEISSFEPVYGMIEDIMSSARELELVLLDESYKIACMEDPAVREFGDMIRDVGFWNDLEAVRSLVRLVKEMAHEFEIERPLVGQCLPLWDELRTKAKEWCSKFHIAEIMVDKVIERQFRKNYHPAWAAAYILDPFYMIRDPAGNYLPPFKYLSPEQQKDVHDLITRLVSREEVTVVMSELMRWRSDGLDPVYAQAVQLKQRDPNTGKMKIANPHGSRLVWETYLPQFESLGKVALRIIFLHATARGFKCNASIMKWVQNHGRSRVALDKAQKMVFIAAHSKLERRDFTSEDDKEAELFASVNGEDDVVNGIFVDQ